MASVLLVLLSLLAIVGAGAALGLSYSHYFGGSSLLDAATFILGVVVVLLARDIVQRYFARKAGGLSTLHYYLPNIPVFLALPVLYFLPTFGAITFVRSPAYRQGRALRFLLLGFHRRGGRHDGRGAGRRLLDDRPVPGSVRLDVRGAAWGF